MNPANDVFGYTKDSLNCRGKLIQLKAPMIMGVVNLTPDSFYDGGKIKSDKDLLEIVEKQLSDGADFIDIGGMSSRPGARIISQELELKRVIEPIEKIHARFPEAIISIDTVHAKTAKEAVEAGAGIINDISAGSIDPEMLKTIARLKVPYVLTHMQGTPDNMQENPRYFNVLTEVIDFLLDRIQLLQSSGVADIIVDPGFGFGKTLEHNYILLKSLNYFKVLDKPVLVGISRKSLICKLLNLKPEEALNGTTALHMIALQNGANILRAHDVAEAAQAIRIFYYYQSQNASNY